MRYQRRSEGVEAWKVPDGLWTLADVHIPGWAFQEFCERSVTIGTWLVQNSNGTVSHYTQEDFQATYEPRED